MKFSEAYDKVFPHEEKKDDPEITPMVPQTEPEEQDEQEEHREDE